MKSDLIINYIPAHSDAWYEYRKDSIGGSECATVLGRNKYDTVTRLFYEKIGVVPPRKFTNEAMFWGTMSEENIANIWKYYDGTETGYIENYKNNKIIRDCRKVNGSVINPKYPWLSASVDRVMNVKGGINLITGEKLKTEAVLECKNLSYNAARMWVDKIPPQYIFQVHQYMIILETDYAEMVILEDGNKLRVEKFFRDEELCKIIIDVTKAFWFNRVLPAKEFCRKKQEAEKLGNMAEVEKWESEIQLYEPEPDNSEAYTEFMNERFLRERDSIEGTMELYDLAKKDKVLNGLKGIIDDERTGIKNIFVKKLTLAGAEMIDFGRVGSVTWSERKGAKNRTFNNFIKEKPSEDQLMAEFRKLNLECY